MRKGRDLADALWYAVAVLRIALVAGGAAVAFFWVEWVGYALLIFLRVLITGS